MTRHRYRWMLVVAAVCLLAPAGWLRAEPTQADTKQGVQPTVVTLENGLQVLLVERHEQPSVAACFIVDVGSCNDPAGRSGIAHMFEHMMFKGSHVIGTTDYGSERAILDKQDELREQMDAEMNRMRLMKRRGQIDDVLDPKQWTPEYTALSKQYDELIEAQHKFSKDNELANIYSANGGASLNAGTSNDMTVYYVQLPANKLELFFWMESDRLANAVMREFYIERNNVREERRLRTESTPIGKYNEAFEAMFWQSHPYGRPVLGWASEVESLTRDDVRSFFDVYYAPNNITMVLVGDFDTEQAIKMARKYFERIPRGQTEPPLLVTEEPKPIAERRFYAEAETNPRVRVRYHTTAMGHEDEAALDVLAELLSGRSGRLYKRLVTAEEAAIGQPRASHMSRKYAGYLELGATVKENRSPEEVERFILEEVDKLREGEISDYELQKVKNQVLASSIQSLRENLGLMFQLAVYETWCDWSYINEGPRRMLEVTADDVRRVVKEYLDPKTRTVAIYVTKEGAATGQDAELEALVAALPPDVQEQARGQLKGMIKHFQAAEDPQLLNQQLQMMEQMLASEQAPEEQKAITEYMVKIIKARVAELEAGDDKSDTTDDESKAANKESD